MNFSLTEAQKLMKQLARDIAQKELAASAAKVDREYLFPWDGIKRLRSAGFTGIIVPPRVWWSWSRHSFLHFSYRGNSEGMCLYRACHSISCCRL